MQVANRRTQEANVLVSEVMTRDVRVASPDHTIEAAARMMAEIDAGVLPVAENDQLVGMITDRDIAVRAVAQGKGPETRVREVMTADVKYCFEDEPITHVAVNMGDLRIRRLPVLNRDKRLVGILSLGDLAQVQGSQPAGQALAGISQPSGDRA
jgi:CBS domain-containing protein